MTVTTANIRDLLNRPRGLNEGTITEYISIRTEQVTKVSRTTNMLAADSTNAVTTAEKESAIKYLVAVDCLRVMIDTIPSYVSKDDSSKREQDIRLATQLRMFENRADEMLALVSDKGGTVFKSKVTKTKLT